MIKPGKDWAGHVPGQYLRVGVDVDGVRLWRTYSLTHGPRPDGCISITVKGIPDGVVSNHLVHRVRARPDDPARPGRGRLRAARRRCPTKLLLVTAGSGITPVIGMLRNLFSRGVPFAADIVLLHSALSRVRGHLRRGAARVRRRRPAAPGRAAHRHPRHARRRRPRRDRPRPGRADRPTPAARSACSTPSRRTTPRATCRCTSSGSAPSRRRAPARAARSASPATARSSRPTARPRSSTPPRAPAC